MRSFAKLIAGTAAAILLTAMSGCGTEAESTGETHVLNLEHRYGFVSLADGSMGVVDLETLSVVNKVKESRRASHMLHVIPDTQQREVLYGDWDTNDVLRLRFSADMKSYEVVERVHSPVQMHGFMTLGADDRYVLVLSRLELKHGVLHPHVHDDSSIGLYDTHTGTWKTLQLQSPSLATLGPDGRLYVTNVHHRTVSIVDLDTFTEVERVAVGPDAWPTAESIGPKHITFSPDGRHMVTADYEGMTLTRFELTANGLENREVIPVNGVPKAVEFSQDGEEMWVVTYDLNVPRTDLVANAGTYNQMGDWYDGPQPANESWNADRKTTMHVFDGNASEAFHSFTTPRAMISPRMSPEEPNVVYVTTSAGSVYSIDRANFRLLGEAVVGRIGTPIICGNLAL